MMHAVKEPLAGLALLVIFGLLIWYNRPNESSHPFDPYPQHQAPRITGDVYEAWLWKDPFGFDPAAASGGAVEAWVRVDKGENPGQESDASGGDRKGEGGKSGRESHDLTCQVALEEMISGTSGEGRSVQILAPLVKVSPHTVEHKEMRTRQRYAVIAGLIESGYRPQEPDRLHFCSIQEDSREYDMRWEHYRHEPGNKPDIVVAWIDSEVFTAGGEFLDVVESRAGRDLASRNRALEKLLSSEKIIPLADETGKKFYIFDVNSILAHQRSEQIKKKICCLKKNVEIIKLAGMEDKKPQVKGSDDKNAESAKLKSMESEKKCEEPAEKPKPDNKNATGNANGKTASAELAEKLAVELALRGININERPEEAIIITEQDSENVATLASDLQNCLNRLFPNKSGKYECGGENSDTTDNEGGPAQISKIRTVFYLKGLDGNPKKTGTQDKKDKNEDQSDDKPERVSIIDLHRPPPLPIGPGQMDYFHRLAEEIRIDHEIIDIDRRDSGSKAVVILGSDFNDKLLIIEALREKMPHLLILTTDLDAQMLYPKHWRSTRNLVVASHFDLLLRKKTKEDENCKGNFWQCAYQDRFPPFRNSDQTNIFYRTLAIAEHNANSINQPEKTFPRIFEVGRNGFVRLNTRGKNAEEKNDGDDLNYHPSDSTQENTAKRLKLLFGIAASLIMFHFVIRPRSGILTTYLFVGTGGIFAIAFVFLFDPDGSREPVTFTDGISLWPVILIQIIAILWAIALFFQAVCELDKNFRGLSWRYFQDCLKGLPVCRDEYELSKFRGWLVRLSHLLKKLLNRWQFKWKPWLDRLCNSNTPSLLVLLFLVVSVAVYAWNDVYPASILSFSLCFISLVVLTILYICLFEIQDGVSIKRWREEDHRRQGETGQAKDSPSACCILHWLRKRRHLNGTTDEPLRRENYENRLWREYHKYGLLDHRVTRVVAIWLFFAIIETLLVYVLPPWPLPCRGSTCGWAPWVGVLSFTITMLLLFFILDAVRLNCFWIRKLRKQHPLLKERISQEDNAAYNRAALHCPAKSLEDIVSLVGERTRAVDKLIYYPMLCIMLMLFAKITYFDNQELPLSKGITFGAAISFLFFSGFMLRHEANELRISVKKSLLDIRRNNGCTQEIITNSIKRINKLDEGAFQPMLEQPVMQALLIVLASIGLFAGEYLKLFG